MALPPLASMKVDISAPKPAGTAFFQCLSCFLQCEMGKPSQGVQSDAVSEVFGASRGEVGRNSTATLQETSYMFGMGWWGHLPLR